MAYNPSVAHNIPSKAQPIILIADNDKISRDNLAILLENEGYRVVTASNGESCLAACQRESPQLVILDAIMPRMNGFECCKRLLALPGSAYTPILMITALDDETTINRAFDCGVTDFITKPIRWPVLRQRVRLLIQKHQLYKEVEEANQKLSQLASVDDLTQLANRRVFSERLQQEWRRMAREKSNLSVILGDIDAFKAYNDTYGHLQGDQCLVKVARGFQQCLKRPADLAARYGGEEFAALLPNTPLAGAVHVAEVIRHFVKALALPHPHSANCDRITISLGVASVIPSPHLMGVELLLQAADQALYQAKAEGRDRVVEDTSLSPF